MAVSTSLAEASPTSRLEKQQPKDNISLANQVIDLISEYGLNKSKPTLARESFLSYITKQINTGATLRLVLPAFPFKSPSNKKVLGTLPDLGEELALVRLQGLCENVRQMYKGGAEVVIVSAGLVYNDLLGVSDEDVWVYRKALMQLAKDKKLTNIHFSNLSNFFPRESSEAEHLVAKISGEHESAYLDSVSSLRKWFLGRYTPPGFDVESVIKNDEDTRKTFEKYLTDLKEDLGVADVGEEGEHDLDCKDLNGESRKHTENDIATNGDNGTQSLDGNSSNGVHVNGENVQTVEQSTISIDKHSNDGNGTNGEDETDQNGSDDIHPVEETEKHLDNGTTTALENGLHFQEENGSRIPQSPHKDIAQAMIIRGAAFAAAIRTNYKDAIRLSVHSSTGTSKLSIQLLDEPENAASTPWHSAISLSLDGAFRTGPAAQLHSTHDLIYRYGRPYYFREKSELFNWDIDVEFEPLYPSGLLIHPSAETSPISAMHLPMQKVRSLSITMSPIILRGFTDTLEESVYVGKGHESGKILPWTFGIIQKVKDAGVNTKMGNNVTSNEAMPMHFDGMFKFEERKDEVTGEVKKVQAPPGYQFFTALATAPEGTGYTLFASSRLFWEFLPKPFTVEHFESIRWNMDNNGFWDAKMKDLPLVVRHPVTKLPCMRWHEPWDETKTIYSTCVVTLDGQEKEKEIIKTIDKLLYDWRVCFRFEWRKGDWLVSDNTSLLHTRTAYTSGCERELWRIHFD
ncbi:Pyoverdine/dityrosine biosynthesis protein-domain-containing protein [Tricladium varicosporioides]|nr:Pyoverdine/dityrosine biosynthesis protein-domain-containing protein [Hymenoscyphus varicosporioides]